jgi:hypothetical protein
MLFVRGIVLGFVRGCGAAVDADAGDTYSVNSSARFFCCVWGAFPTGKLSLDTLPLFFLDVAVESLLFVVNVVATDASLDPLARVVFDRASGSGAETAYWVATLWVGSSEASMLTTGADFLPGGVWIACCDDSAYGGGSWYSFLAWLTFKAPITSSTSAHRTCQTPTVSACPAFISPSTRSISQRSAQ